MRKIFPFMFLVFSINAYAQSTIEELLREADNYISDKEYGKAVDKLFNAILDDKERKEFQNITNRIKDLTILIGKQRDDAITNALKADQAAKDSENARKELELTNKYLQLISDSLEVANKTLDSLKNIALVERDIALNEKEIIQEFEKITRTLNVAAKVIQMNSNEELRAALAASIFNINENSKFGKINHPDIYQALFKAYHSLNKEQYKVNLHNGPIRSIIVHDNYLYSASGDGQVKRIKLSKGEKKTGDEEEILSINLANYGIFEGKNQTFYLVSNQSPNLTIFNSSGKQFNQILSNNFSNITDIFLSENQILVSTNQGVFSFDQELKNFNKVFQFEKGIVQMCLFENQLVFLCEDGNIYSNEQTAQIHNKLNLLSTPKVNISCISAYEPKKFFAYGTDEGQVVLITENMQFQSRPHTSRISSIKFSPNGRWMVAASYDGTVSVWDMNHFSELDYKPWIIDEIGTWALAIAFSTDEERLYIGNKNGELMYWYLYPSFYYTQICDALGEKTHLDDTLWRSFFGDDIVQPKLANKQ